MKPFQRGPIRMQGVLQNSMDLNNFFFPSPILQNPSSFCYEIHLRKHISLRIMIKLSAENEIVSPISMIQSRAFAGALTAVQQSTQR